MADPAASIDNLLLNLVNHSETGSLLLQAMVLASSIFASWLLTLSFGGSISRLRNGWVADPGGLRKTVFLLIALILVWLGREQLRVWHGEPHLINFFLPLIAALVVVRLLVHGLRFALKNGASLKSWERGISWIIWIGVSLHVTGVLPRVSRALDTVSFESGSHHFSLLLLIKALFVIALSLIGSLWLAQLVESQLMRLPNMDLSLRLALSKIVRSFLLLMGVLIALPAVGIDLTVLSVFGGALGVGLGFGLQKVASNYVSGFIILLDRSVRIGDLITVDNKYGEVTQINTRYTLLKARDGTESILPNEMLISQTVVNHSLSRPDIRMKLPIQVSYATDLDQASEILTALARQHPRVRSGEGEAPKVQIASFGDNGINLNLVIWISDAQDGQNNLISDLNWSIWRAFREHGIEIPFPQRVVHLSQPETN